MLGRPCGLSGAWFPVTVTVPLTVIVMVIVIVIVLINVIKRVIGGGINGIPAPVITDSNT